MDLNRIGGWAFIAGLVLAIIFSLFPGSSWVVPVLVILGLVVGLFNVTGKETRSFLLASVAFLLSFQALASVFSNLAFGWTAVATFFNLLSVFVAPAAAIVALITLFNIAKD